MPGPARRCGRAAQAEAAEAKLWAAVAALEETAALARHLAAHAEAGDDPVSQPNTTIKWATDLADTVRAEMRKVPDAGAGEE
jgi:two-component system chemotaxis response regulator CheB